MGKNFLVAFVLLGMLVGYFYILTSQDGPVNFSQLKSILPAPEDEAFAAPTNNIAPVTPEPVTSVLFIAGGATMLGKKFMKRRG